MARLYEDSEEDFPDLAELLQQVTTSRHRSQIYAVAVANDQEQEPEEIRQYTGAGYQTNKKTSTSRPENVSPKKVRRQRPLKSLPANSPSQPSSPRAAQVLESPSKGKYAKTLDGSWGSLEAVSPPTNKNALGGNRRRTSQKGVLGGQQKSRNKSRPTRQSGAIDTNAVIKSDEEENSEYDILRGVKQDGLQTRLSNTSSNEDDQSAFLAFSAPFPISPCKASTPFATPPPSPSCWTRRTLALGSPSKQLRIPPSPHRPSIDAFWSQTVINEWNDQYSPMKTPNSPHIKGHHLVTSRDEESCSFTGSPRKHTPISPPKKDSKASKAKKAFNFQKHDLAKAFLKELDDTVTGGKVALMAASAGGIHIIWSKKLNSTAGRANWKKEYLRTRDEDGMNAQEESGLTTHRHIASIELAEKVIDNEDRLINVIAHEYCHLANFMISEVRDNPHGKDFKAWAKKCSNAFRHRGIEVTTKHSYTIDYKYIWECTKCGTTFKRHSKSIDPIRHTCGACKAKLVQTQPTPRAVGPSDYQLFVKKHFRNMKHTNPGVPHKSIMSLLGTAYKHQKATDGPSVSLEIRSATNTGCIDNSKAIGDLELVGEEVDSVARTLDFLSLVEP
ncbi:MAG: hypothetical protein M1812_000887 [Candelaria pacifica]|nr:MAG: hypothetical protein M1812_000887 [Candelaria pacifica]